MEPDSEVIVCDSFLRFSGKTFIRKLTRIMEMV
jgi:hypothetical protein